MHEVDVYFLDEDNPERHPKFKSRFFTDLTDIGLVLDPHQKTILTEDGFKVKGKR